MHPILKNIIAGNIRVGLVQFNWPQMEVPPVELVFFFGYYIMPNYVYIALNKTEINDAARFFSPVAV